MLAAACAAVGALVGIIVIPQHFSDAAATAVSTIYTTGSNASNGTTAASSDAPKGVATGTAKPGDLLKWIVPYQNNTGANASVNLKDDLSKAGAFVAGSLQLPPAQSAAGGVTPQYTTGGAWTTGLPPASATGVGFTATIAPQGTQQLSVPFSEPPRGTITMTGGDAYNVVVRNSLVYAVYHHSTGPYVFCAQASGSTCPGWPTNSNVQSWSATVGAPIGTGTPFAGKTPQQAGTWLVGAKLYWYNGLTDNSSVGISCLDLSPATPTSCGYTPRAGGAVDNVTYGAQINGTGLPASNGNTYSAAVHAGSQAVLLCTTPTMVACAGATLRGAGVTTSTHFTSSAFGDYVFASVRQASTNPWQTFCFNTTTGALCPGSWPINSSLATANKGTPFAPILSKSGALTGICTLVDGIGTSSQCLSLTGASVSNPYDTTGAGFPIGANDSGDAYAVGTKVYVSNGNQVICLDFANWGLLGRVPACAGFTVVGNARNYTVRDATDIGSGCLVATGDGGQIVFFNASTGGTCTSTPPATMTVTPQGYYCGTGAASFSRWGTLTLPGLVSITYANSSVTLRDQNNAVISGFDNVTVSRGGSLSLAAIPTTVTSITASVTVNGVTNAAGVITGQIAISWVGNPPEMCFQTKAPAVACDAAAALIVSNQATAVTTSTAGSDAPAGNTTGVAQFSDRADPSQCGLAVKKVSAVQSAHPGDKVTYTITVKNTGTQSYTNATFSDDLTDVLKDARYNGDQSASTGTASWSTPVLSWSGGLAPAAVATVTYSVTVNNPDAGDHTLINTVVSPTTGSNCLLGSNDPLCTVTVVVSVSDVLWRKTDATAAKNILPGAAWTFTPVDGAGKPTGPAITVTDCVAESASSCTGSDLDPLGGSFRITNLGPGTYQLRETQAPVGFMVAPNPITVTILAASTTVTLADVQNKQLPVPLIPLTGGIGTDVLTFTGAGLLTAMLCLAAVHLLRRRRLA